ERLVLRLRRGGAARREIPEQAVAAAHDRPTVAGEVVRESETGSKIALRIRLEISPNLDAIDDGIVGRHDELADGWIEVRLPIVDLDPRHVHVPPKSGIHGELVADADVVLEVRRDLGTRFGVRVRVE